MQLKRKTPPSLFDRDQRTAPQTSNRLAVAGRRAIQVPAGETVVVTPKLPGFYKSMIWFSFLLNAVLLLVLLIGGLTGLRLWREYRGITSLLSDQVNNTGVLGDSVRDLVEQASTGAEGRTEAVNSALAVTQSKLNTVVGAVEGLENATIKATIPIDKQLPIALQVPVDQNTTVVLTEPVPLSANATIVFPAGGGTLNARVSLVLPKDLQLPVHLGMTIPLNSSVPVQFDVPVNIPLRDTELAGPFAQLRELLQPLTEFFTPSASPPTPNR